jgi:hypothetical protein
MDAAIEHNAEVVRRGRRKHGFLKQLGLSLPVTVADVKQAFFVKARQTHPDHHGDAAEFRKVQEAFDEALDYAQKNGKRLPWLGAQLPMYLAQRNVLDLVERVGGTAVIEQLEWLDETVGEDFSQLADRLREIDLTDRPVDDAQLAQMLEDRDGVRYLESLRLAGTRVSDAGAGVIAAIPSLKQIDLRRTDVSPATIRRLRKLPHVEKVDGQGGIGDLLSGWFS